MKKLLLLAALFLLIGANSNEVQAQTTTSFDRPLIWGPSPFQDSLWAVDTSTWQVVRRLGPTLAGFTITGMTGLAVDPTTGITYVLMKISGNPFRSLGIIDLNTGVCTLIVDLGAKFSTISFRDDGQLFAVTGNGAIPSETLFMIDKVTADTNLIMPLGSGADGEIICHNPNDGHFYHWSGNGTVVMEKILDTIPYTITNIPVIGITGGETFGALFNGNDQFIMSNISSSFRRTHTNGSYDAASLMSLPDDLRGTVMLPYFNTSDDTICANESITIIAGGHALLTDLYFHWGDGNDDSVATVDGVLNNVSHTYAAPGSYTIYVETYNGWGGDTVYSYVIQVQNIPVVALSGFSVVCSGDSVTLTGSSGGTSQWYMNGVLIPGATTNTYSTDQAGVYNMTKTNLNGCSDSAAVGITVTIGSYPTVSLGSDAAYCDMTMLDASNAGSSFLWSNADTNQTIMVMTSGSYSVDVTNASGCSASDTIVITINTSPVVNLGSDTSACDFYILDAGNPTASFSWSTGGNSQLETVTTSGIYSVFVTDVNGCVDSDSVMITINVTPVVLLGPDMSDCNSVTLTSNLTTGMHMWSDNSMNLTLDVFASGTFWLSVSDSTSSCFGLDSIDVIIFGDPIVTSSASSTSVCADDADVTLTGSPAGGTFSGTSVTGSNFNPSVGAGSYPVVYTFTDGNGCSGTSTVTITVSACVGIVENTNTAFTLYPNPSTGILNLNLPQDGSTVQVFDVLGNEVSVQKYNNAGTVQVDLSSQPQGVYFVQVTAGSNKNVQKVIIQK